MRWGHSLFYKFFKKVGQVGQVGQAQKNHGLLASNLPTRGRTAVDLGWTRYPIRCNGLGAIAYPTSPWPAAKVARSHGWRWLDAAVENLGQPRAITGPSNRETPGKE
jgi:hypothetical protein